MTDWITWEGKNLPPAFYERDMVQVEYRDGRVRGPECDPWMFHGWNHTGDITDIVRYRVID